MTPDPPRKPPKPPAPSSRNGGWRTLIEGLEGDAWHRRLEKDANRAYSVLSRRSAAREGVLSEPPPSANAPASWLRRAKLLFLGLASELSPPRRLVFAGALLAAFLGVFDVDWRFDAGGTRFSFDTSPLLFLGSITGLVFLLAVEAVDRIRVRDELEVARALQRDLLPQRPPEIPGWRIAHAHRHAAEIGGDYHAFLPLPGGRVAVTVGDASGHGMAAGLLMAIADATLRTAVDIDPQPAAVASLLNRRLFQTGDRRSFFSLFYAILDPVSGDLDWTIAGHPYPLLFRSPDPRSTNEGAGGEARIEELGEGGLPLGLREQRAFATGRTRLEPGDRLLLLTDGVPEAVDLQGAAFGFERLRTLGAPSGDALATLDRVVRALERHLGDEPILDDWTIVALERRVAVEVPPQQLAAAGEEVRGEDVSPK